MRYINKFLFLSVITTLALTACNKIENLPLYKNGTTPVLTSSVTVVAAIPADSLNPALTLSWSFPEYATDSANMKYVVEIDSSGRNFLHAATRKILGDLSTTFTAKELNTILLGYGFAFGVPYDMDVRVISSYANNNEQLISNTLTVKMTPYKIPPKVALPASGRLFIVGDATDFGWTNDAAPPFPAVREFTQLGETKWGAIFNMQGSGGYKILQTQGNWDTQFHMVPGGDPLTGSFVLENADPAFQSPPAGAYKVILDFQSGTYDLTRLDNPLLPDLYVTGDAVTPNWVNNPPPDLAFTPITNGVFEITLALVPGKVYKFLSSFGNWQPQFGGSSATSGDLSANYGGGSDPSAIPTPAEAGNYKIQVNFLTNTYTVTKL